MANRSINSSNIAVIMAVVILVVLPTQQQSAWAQKCSSTSGAPKLSDVNTCLTHLRSIGSQKCCQQKSPNGSCTTMAISGGAIVEICGTTRGCTTCSTAATAIASIANQCSDNYGGFKRVSGTTSYSGFTFRIRHT